LKTSPAKTRIRDNAKSATPAIVPVLKKRDAKADLKNDHKNAKVATKDIQKHDLTKPVKNASPL